MLFNNNNKRFMMNNKLNKIYVGLNNNETI